jgi:hypothetical protein
MDIFDCITYRCLTSSCFFYAAIDVVSFSLLSCLRPLWDFAVATPSGECLLFQQTGGRSTCKFSTRPRKQERIAPSGDWKLTWKLQISLLCRNVVSRNTCCQNQGDSSFGNRIMAIRRTTHWIVNLRARENEQSRSLGRDTTIHRARPSVLLRRRRKPLQREVHNRILFPALVSR